MRFAGQRWRFVLMIVPAQEFVAERFHFHGQHLDFAAEVTEGNQGRDSDAQAQERCVKGQANSFGEARLLFGARLAHGGEESDQSVDSADQTEQGSDAYDDFQDD